MSNRYLSPRCGPNSRTLKTEPSKSCGFSGLSEKCRQGLAALRRTIIMPGLFAVLLGLGLTYLRAWGERGAFV